MQLYVQKCGRLERVGFIHTYYLAVRVLLLSARVIYKDLLLYLCKQI